MKSLRRVLAVGVVATFATVAFAVQAPADHTEPRLTLQIDPDQGPVGQNIHALVPDEYRDICLNENSALAAFQAIVSDLILGFTPGTSPEGVVEALLDAGVAGLTAADLENFAFLFVLAFVDPVTQDPVVDENTGEEALSNWSAVTGEGTIIAPFTTRPATYFVAAVCLDFQVPSPEAFARLIQDTAAALDPTELLTCAGGGFATPECQALAEEIVGGLVEELLLLAVNQDADIAWVAPFCLTGDAPDFQGCEVPVEPVAEPVAAAPTFAG